jgi:hypothetical protein
MTLPFPFTGVLDNFNRANVGPPPSANWNSSIRLAGGTPALSTTDAGLKVVSNALQGAKDVSLGGNLASSGYWKTAFSRNHEVYVTLGAAYVPAGGAPPTWTGYVELYARGTGLGTATFTAYTLEWRPDTNYISLGKVSNTNTNGTLLRSVMPVSLVAGDSIGLRVYNDPYQDVQEAWYKKAGGAWTLLGQSYSTDLPSGGQIGVLLLDSARNLDDFGGGSIPMELLNVGQIAPSGAERRAITIAPANSPKGTIAPAGVPTKLITKSAPFTGVIAGPATFGAMLAQAATPPLEKPLGKYAPGMDEMLYASLPWPEAQVQLAAPGVEGRPVSAECGWHGTSLDPWRGSFAIVARDGPLGDMVGERLAITRRDLPVARTVYVYVHTDSDELTEDVSLTRRAFMALGDPALDSVSVMCDVVGPSG